MEVRIRLQCLRCGKTSEVKKELSSDEEEHREAVRQEGNPFPLIVECPECGEIQVVEIPPSEVSPSSVFSGFLYIAR